MPLCGSPDVLKARHGPLRVHSSPFSGALGSLLVEKVLGTGIKWRTEKQTNSSQKRRWTLSRRLEGKKQLKRT